MFFKLFTPIALFTLCCSGEKPPEVEMGYTYVSGKVVHAQNSSKPVYAFLGVPYASPPVGDLRFSYPKRLPPMDREFDATNHPPLCPQDVNILEKAFSNYYFPRTDISEDCLYLNIYTPTLDKSAELAVMVWIHGGAFMNGGASAYDGSAYATYQNVIFVAMNYRLGALGFLCTEDANAPGNYGLLDQQIALRWIKSNIRHFGGDPSKVTIFGESAGGMSVGLHYLSRHSRGVFERGIAESGFANTPIAYTKNPKKWASVLARELGCPDESNEDLINCLLEKPANEIVHAKLDVPNKPVIVFGPVVDGYFLPDDPIKLTFSSLFHRKDVLIGINNHEGGYSMLKTRISPDLAAQFSVEMFEPALNQMISSFLPGDNQNIVKKITKEYLLDDKDDLNALVKLTEVIGDSFFLTPAVTFVKLLTAAGGKSFLYEFQHRPSFATSPEWVGADHGDEERFVIGFPLMVQNEESPIAYTTEEVQLARTIMTYWANFAKYGDPNGDQDGTSLAPHWQPYNVDEQYYMKLDVTSELSQNLKDDRVVFWTDILASLVSTPSTKDEL
ncbi:fatty acyl-CoA hydrolase precursor, medium chain-like [Antedon mediterranea]|uniref:fatty acyl-CoA hydrolase precursor, medium chain-like n=1 Tax=Antedon mediterranea TaxID=105859 RepID=UPI003AF6B92E